MSLPVLTSMIFDRETHTRRNSLRLRGFDYSWPRIYFVTINAANRRPIFNDSRVALATIDCLKQLREKLGFTIYVFCLMPDHFHALIGPGTSKQSLGRICGSFKSISTRRSWRWYNGKLWHRQFYDHIIPNRDDFDETLVYIRMNQIGRAHV